MFVSVKDRVINLDRMAYTYRSAQYTIIVFMKGVNEDQDTDVWISDEEGGLALWHWLHYDGQCIRIVPHDFYEGFTDEQKAAMKEE